MNKYLVKNFKSIENLGKVPAKVYRLAVTLVIKQEKFYFFIYIFTNRKIFSCNFKFLNLHSS